MKYEIKIAWLYPDLMSTYADRGNIIALQRRCEWRNIKIEVDPITVGSSSKLLSSCSLLFMGGGEDRQQKIVSDDFQKGKAKIFREMIENNTPGLFICGAYQFLGKYYKEADSTVIEGLGILDIYTENPGPGHKRLIGNMAFETELVCHSERSEESLANARSDMKSEILCFTQDDKVAPRNEVIVGFENHGGRTYLGSGVKPFGKVIQGHGNNGEDDTEGAIYKNIIGSYSHGPLLPKNPQIADWLIAKALEVKYGEKIVLDILDDSLEEEAKKAIAERLNIRV